MPRNYQRSVEAFSIHGHIDPGSPDESLVDYDELFDSIATAVPDRLRHSIQDETVAIVDTRPIEGGLALRVVSGRADEVALLYDEASGQVTPVRTGEGMYIVRGIWIVVRRASRILLVERKRPGVPVFQVERLLSSFGKQHFRADSFKVALNPIASPSFEAEVLRLRRIRQASITMRRPNESWTEAARGFVGQLGASNAGELQLQLKAERGQSLARDSGIVAEVLSLAREPISELTNVSVSGTAPDSEDERTVSLKKHVVKGSVQIPSGSTPNDDLNLILEIADELMERASNGRSLE